MNQLMLEYKKSCIYCKEIKPKTEFYLTKNKNRIYVQSECKECAKKRVLKYYNLNKEKELIKRKKTGKIYRLKALSLINPKLKCVRCGFNDKRALQFDHIDGGGTKEMREKFKHNNEKKCKYYINSPELARKTLQVLCSNCNWIKRHENNELLGRGKK